RYLIYLLQNSILESHSAVRSGCTFVVEGSSMKFRNFDPRLERAVLSSVQNCMPARVKKILVIEPPFFFNIIWKVVRLMLKEKIRGRLSVISSSQLIDHIPVESIP